MLVTFSAMTGDDGSSVEIPAGALRSSDDLSNAARFTLADRELAVRVWPRRQWEHMLPESMKPAGATTTPDGCYYVAVDLVARRG